MNKQSTIYAATLITAVAGAAHGQTGISISDPAVGGNQNIVSIDLKTGKTTDLGFTNAERIEGLTVDDNGRVLGTNWAGNNSFRLWDLTTAPGIELGGDPAGGRIAGFQALAFNPVDKQLYNIAGNGGWDTSPNGMAFLYRIDPNTQRVTRLSTSSARLNWFADSLAIDENGRAYAGDFAGQGVLHEVDLRSGRSSIIGSLDVPVVDRLSGMDFDSSGTLWALVGEGDIYTIDTVSGHATYVSTIDRPAKMWYCLAVLPEVPCFADCDQSTGIGVLDIFDFLCFQGSFVGGDPYACDCDTSTGPGVCDVFDFLCFQDNFVAGCP